MPGRQRRAGGGVGMSTWAKVKELRARMEAMTPMRRLGTVDDIALAALWLCSPAGAWVTGKVVEVDGGTETTNWPFD